MRLHPVSTRMHGTSSPLLLESLSVSQAAVTLLKPSPTPTLLPALPSSPDNTFSLFQSPTPHPALWLCLKVEDNYVRMLDMNSLKRLEYCSGFTVEISAPACKTQRPYSGGGTAPPPAGPPGETIPMSQKCLGPALLIHNPRAAPTGVGTRQWGDGREAPELCGGPSGEQ